ncbi:hypothetical protein AX17_007079 [Amanita inopinata Kibby_2008]|nr:hypothetical protein AX17_007079 [Amanita inopinata Kibby_2008]
MDDSLNQRLIPIACRYVPYDQWLVTHIQPSWKISQLKLYILSKCIGTPFHSDTHPLAHRPPSPITFAPDPKQRSVSPILFASPARSRVRARSRTLDSNNNRNTKGKTKASASGSDRKDRVEQDDDVSRGYEEDDEWDGNDTEDDDDLVGDTPSAGARKYLPNKDSPNHPVPSSSKSNPSLRTSLQDNDLSRSGPVSPNIKRSVTPSSLSRSTTRITSSTTVSSHNISYSATPSTSIHTSSEVLPSPPPAAYTLIRFSTGQLLENGLLVSNYDLAPYELLELHGEHAPSMTKPDFPPHHQYRSHSKNRTLYPGPYPSLTTQEQGQQKRLIRHIVTLDRSNVQAYVTPYWEGWVRALRVINRDDLDAVMRYEAEQNRKLRKSRNHSTSGAISDSNNGRDARNLYSGMDWGFGAAVGMGGLGTSLGVMVGEEALRITDADGLVMGSEGEIGAGEKGRDFKKKRGGKEPKRKSNFEWTERWVVIRDGMLHVCKDREDINPTDRRPLSSLVTLRGVEHLASYPSATTSPFASSFEPHPHATPIPTSTPDPHAFIPFAIGSREKVKVSDVNNHSKYVVCARFRTRPTHAMNQAILSGGGGGGGVGEGSSKPKPTVSILPRPRPSSSASAQSSLAHRDRKLLPSPSLASLLQPKGKDQGRRLSRHRSQYTITSTATAASAPASIPPSSFARPSLRPLVVPNNPDSGVSVGPSAGRASVSPSVGVGLVRRRSTTVSSPPAVSMQIGSGGGSRYSSEAEGGDGDDDDDDGELRFSSQLKGKWKAREDQDFSYTGWIGAGGKVDEVGRTRERAAESGDDRGGSTGGGAEKPPVVFSEQQARVSIEYPGKDEFKSGQSVGASGRRTYTSGMLPPVSPTATTSSRGPSVTTEGDGGTARPDSRPSSPASSSSYNNMSSPIFAHGSESDWEKDLFGVHGRRQQPYHYGYRHAYRWKETKETREFYTQPSAVRRDWKGREKEKGPGWGGAGDKEHGKLKGKAKEKEKEKEKEKDKGKGKTASKNVRRSDQYEWIILDMGCNTAFNSILRVLHRHVPPISSSFRSKFPYELPPESTANEPDPSYHSPHSSSSKPGIPSTRARKRSKSGDGYNSSPTSTTNNDSHRRPHRHQRQLTLSSLASTPRSPTWTERLGVLPYPEWRVSVVKRAQRAALGDVGNAMLYYLFQDIQLGDLLSEVEGEGGKERKRRSAQSYGSNATATTRPAQGSESDDTGRFYLDIGSSGESSEAEWHGWMLDLSRQAQAQAEREGADVSDLSTNAPQFYNHRRYEAGRRAALEPSGTVTSPSSQPSSAIVPSTDFSMTRRLSGVMPKLLSAAVNTSEQDSGQRDYSRLHRSSTPPIALTSLSSPSSSESLMQRRLAGLVSPKPQPLRIPGPSLYHSTSMYANLLRSETITQDRPLRRPSMPHLTVEQKPSSGASGSGYGRPSGSGAVPMLRSTPPSFHQSQGWGNVFGERKKHKYDESVSASVSSGSPESPAIQRRASSAGLVGVSIGGSLGRSASFFSGAGFWRKDSKEPKEGKAEHDERDKKGKGKAKAVEDEDDNKQVGTSRKPRFSLLSLPTASTPPHPEPRSLLVRSPTYSSFLRRPTSGSSLLSAEEEPPLLPTARVEKKKTKRRSGIAREVEKFVRGFDDDYHED